MTLHDVLEHYFGFSDFRPGQEDAVRSLLEGHDTLAVMPTGSGKSLIYQLAALQLPGTALVISPLVALMKDQSDSLARRGIASTFINSSLGATEEHRRLVALAQNKYKIVLIAPERLRNGGFRAAIARLLISLLVVDEAHCVSEWGHDFRPDYLHIAAARREFATTASQAGHTLVTLALTATATVRVQNEIVTLLGLNQPRRFVLGFNRPNLKLGVLKIQRPPGKLHAAREFVTSVKGAGIIYTGTRREAEEVAKFARQVIGIQAEHYHAGLDARTRSALQDSFLAGKLPLIVATNAFGMGIDRPDVRYVLHYTIPSSLEAYYQEAGRAGRDGLPARATLIYSPKDISLREWFIENDSPSPADLRRVHQLLQLNTTVTLNEILQIAGLSEIKVRVAAELLERHGIVVQHPAQHRDNMRYEVKPLTDEMIHNMVLVLEARRHHNRIMLQKVVAYAQTKQCRRRVILDYFGDRSAAAAVECCDNHIAPRAANKSTPKQPVRASAANPLLFARLNAWRLAEARTQHVPDYAIMPDTTLHQIAALKPKTPESLLRISGMNRLAVQKYGSQLLALVASFSSDLDAK